jgi:hypothetical protein
LETHSPAKALSNVDLPKPVSPVMQMIVPHPVLSFAILSRRTESSFEKNISPDKSLAIMQANIYFSFHQAINMLL